MRRLICSYFFLSSLDKKWYCELILNSFWSRPFSFFWEKEELLCWHLSISLLRMWDSVILACNYYNVFD